MFRPAAEVITQPRTALLQATGTVSPYALHRARGALIDVFHTGIGLCDVPDMGTDTDQSENITRARDLAAELWDLDLESTGRRTGGGKAPAPLGPAGFQETIHAELVARGYPVAGPAEWFGGEDAREDSSCESDDGTVAPGTGRSEVAPQAG